MNTWLFLLSPYVEKFDFFHSLVSPLDEVMTLVEYFQDL